MLITKQEEALFANNPKIFLDLYSKISKLTNKVPTHKLHFESADDKNTSVLLFDEIDLMFLRFAEDVLKEHLGIDDFTDYDTEEFSEIYVTNFTFIESDAIEIIFRDWNSLKLFYLMNHNAPINEPYERVW